MAHSVRPKTVRKQMLLLPTFSDGPLIGCLPPWEDGLDEDAHGSLWRVPPAHHAEAEPLPPGALLEDHGEGGEAQGGGGGGGGEEGAGGAGGPPLERRGGAADAIRTMEKCCFRFFDQNQNSKANQHVLRGQKSFHEGISCYFFLNSPGCREVCPI